MPKNIVSGFRATGSHPFDVNNVDFSEIILGQVETSNNADIEEVKHHLHYIEGHIEPAILAQFKEAKAENYDWDGNTEATMLFDFWLRVSNETEESNKENFTNRLHVTANSPGEMQSQSPEVTINQQSTPETPKVTTSTDDSDNPNVGVIPSTSNITTFHDYSEHHDVDVHPSTSNVIIVPPKRNLTSVFDDIVPWPSQKHTSGKREKNTPQVLSHLMGAVSSTENTGEDGPAEIKGTANER
ncbi:hypothetical protein JTB14_004885 [Gonioctena quinquepunctata]|nr:hypothetical protein JTB14_004885 [Gonioctena quinquepunctata]